MERTVREIRRLFREGCLGFISCLLFTWKCGSISERTVRGGGDYDPPPKLPTRNEGSCKDPCSVSRKKAIPYFACKYEHETCWNGTAFGCWPANGDGGRWVGLQYPCDQIFSSFGVHINWCFALNRKGKFFENKKGTIF